MRRPGFDDIVLAVVGFALATAQATAWSGEEARASVPAPEATGVERLDIEWKQARGCWQRIARIDGSGTRFAYLGRRALDRFLESAHARELVVELCSLVPDVATKGAQPWITVRFVDELPASLDLPEGSFQPPRAGADVYEITILMQREREIFDGTVFIFGQYPDNPDCAYTFYYQQPVSSMAQVLYHELLHIWYLNVYADVERRYPTGHGLVTRCQFDDEFLELLAGNAAELSTIEGHPPLNFDAP